KKSRNPGDLSALRACIRGPRSRILHLKDSPDWGDCARGRHRACGWHSAGKLMSDILFQYHKVWPTTWVYLSSLLTIGLFFKFSRFWSIRNLDLILLILFSPGLILINYGVVHSRIEIEQAGYVWLFGVALIFLLRLLLYPLMV